MPTGKKWSKNQGQWVDVQKERPVDYEGYDDDSWGLLISYFREYPDKLLDLLESENPHYNLEPIQRVMLRAQVRYEESFTTGSRGTTKTYVVMLSGMLEGIVYPGTIKRYFGPTFKQTAELAGAAFTEISYNYPGLASHWRIVTNAKDTFEIATPYHSVFSINAMRGDTAHSVIAEECAQESDSGDQPFDHEKYRSSILPSIRAQRMINRVADPYCPSFQKTYITSAGRKQNEAFEYRKNIFSDMVDGKNAFAIDIPAEVSVLSGIRSIQWYKDLKRKLTPEEWLREMASVWTGTSENPVIRDTVLSESKSLMVMEDRHCGDPNVIYIISNDVSYKEGANNAKCATAVLKCEQQESEMKRDKFLKSVVYLFDNPPPLSYVKQAMQIKKMWSQYCLEGGQPTYIAVDTNSNGDAVLKNLFQDLGDGLPPLCCMNHYLQELEQPGALPVIYPIRATPGMTGQYDPDGLSLQYCELEWEHRNVRLLTSNVYEGVQAYKRVNKIKNDEADSGISLPYIKTKEMCAQVANLKKKVSGKSISEERISKSIQRDMWSAVKYAMRTAQIIENEMLANANRKQSSWAKAFRGEESIAAIQIAPMQQMKARAVGRGGGNIR